MKHKLFYVIALLSGLAITSCGENQQSSMKDLESGTDCTDLYRYGPNESPGFKVQDLPSNFYSVTGLTRGADGLTWQKAGWVQQVYKNIYRYNPPKPGYLFFGQSLPIDKGGTIRAEIDFEAFESFVTWDIYSGGASLTSETVRYEANQPISGTWYSKAVPVGDGFPNLEVRGYVKDIKDGSSQVGAHEQLAWVPSVKIKQIRIIHSSPGERVNAGDPSCRM